MIDEIIAEPYLRHGINGTKSQTHAELKSDMRQYLRVHQRPKVVIADQAVTVDRVWSRVKTVGLNVETGDLSTIWWLQVHRVDQTGCLAEVWTMYSFEAGWD